MPAHQEMAAMQHSNRSPKGIEAACFKQKLYAGQIRRNKARKRIRFKFVLIIYGKN
jgi:hypothetical protein